ncbi:MAG: Glu/Leu/Phe/Val dehydrogenase [Bacteroidetes bacterium]|uniref:Glu/Leu/Phe/Val dehydrogenase n=1 Tax=Phaeocystidibacter marisrubri TaxID=1577780 RepID=A0A6L3ZEF7_9FLAO|nr:Glu/Leu/Phe/Val dehydrogenase dimerization domain-containing protein [Phaeocystidibacter marisrubri]KAB2815988.1 Glu/Leu/Phe/Val dehydrogenase [Phaeocystidibacter marisrubri]TNE27799.1 MAG: Glu/Leu/Phe/Val dehydrogenase [Bacteroidota bacterium]GGH66753.1 amino acid dehydrogenase [Phaeocystidibacter marisrubri]
MKDRLKAYEQKPAEIVFHWQDSETEARGWTVINSLRGGAAGGGTRMRAGLTEHEVLSLAKTMEIKFTVAGPAIGGAKSGIDFDPNDPRKDGVLRRWYNAVRPLLKNYYGTGGDLNVDQKSEVIPITRELGILHPQEGVLQGHYNPSPEDKALKIRQLQDGVSLMVKDETLTPNTNGDDKVGDLITGYGVAESVRHFYEIWGGDLSDKRVIIQGWGVVAAPAAYYLSQAGAKIVGIIDRVGGLVKEEGFTFEEIKELVLAKTGNFLVSDNMMSFEEANEKIWSIGAEVFIPAAASRLITREQLDTMSANGLEVISSGANVPFADREIFYGPIAEHADNSVAVIPDFISNCGMARVFGYLMQDHAEVTDVAIFKDTSNVIREALAKVHAKSDKRTHVTDTAYSIALDQLN